MKKPSVHVPEAEPRLFASIADTAKRLSISPRYVHMLLRRPRDPLPSVKLGRRRLVPIAAAEQWAAAQQGHA